MTQREFYNEVANCTNLSTDARAIAQAWVDKDAEKYLAKKAENAELCDASIALLKGSNEPMTASAVADNLGISTPKATSILKSIEGIKVTDVRVGNRIVKGYSL